MDIGRTCYACEKMATSYEHIPPKSFFAGIDYQDRKLIKVPSCEEHNLQKTGDDEYFRNLLSMHIDSKDQALALFHKKTLRSLHDSPTKMKNFMGGVRKIYFHGQPTGVLSVDETKVDIYFSLMARGLYYNHFLEKYQKDFAIFPISFDDENEEKKKFKLIDRLKSIGLRKYGYYPDIFYYQEMIDSEKFFGFRMVFFGGVVILAGTENPAGQIR